MKNTLIRSGRFWVNSMAKSNIEKYNESLTSAERIENARKSGIASGKARREGRLLRESLLQALESKDVLEDICKALIDRAVNGDVSAIRLLRDSIGELPSMAINLQEGQYRDVVLVAHNDAEVEAFKQVEERCLKLILLSCCGIGMKNKLFPQIAGNCGMFILQICYMGFQK